MNDYQSDDLLFNFKKASNPQRYAVSTRIFYVSDN